MTWRPWRPRPGDEAELAASAWTVAPVGRIAGRARGAGPEQRHVPDSRRFEEAMFGQPEIEHQRIAGLAPRRCREVSRAGPERSAHLRPDAVAARTHRWTEADLDLVRTHAERGAQVCDGRLEDARCGSPPARMHGGHHSALPSEHEGGHAVRGHHTDGQTRRAGHHAVRLWRLALPVGRDDTSAVHLPYRAHGQRDASRCDRAIPGVAGGVGAALGAVEEAVSNAGQCRPARMGQHSGSATGSMVTSLKRSSSSSVCSL
jgi:hypothetical protein